MISIMSQMYVCTGIGKRSLTAPKLDIAVRFSVCCVQLAIAIFSRGNTFLILFTMYHQSKFTQFQPLRTATLATMFSKKNFSISSSVAKYMYLNVGVVSPVSEKNGIFSMYSNVLLEQLSISSFVIRRVPSTTVSSVGEHTDIVVICCFSGTGKSSQISVSMSKVNMFGNFFPKKFFLMSSGNSRMNVLMSNPFGSSVQYSSHLRPSQQSNLPSGLYLYDLNLAIFLVQRRLLPLSSIYDRENCFLNFE